MPYQLRERTNLTVHVEREVVSSHPPYLSELSMQLAQSTSASSKNHAELILAWENVLDYIKGGIALAEEVGDWIVADKARSRKLASALVGLDVKSVDSVDAQSILRHLFKLPIATKLNAACTHPAFRKDCTELANSSGASNRTWRKRREESCREFLQAVAGCMMKQHKLPHMLASGGLHKVFYRDDAKCYLQFFHDESERKKAGHGDSTSIREVFIECDKLLGQRQALNKGDRGTRRQGRRQFLTWVNVRDMRRKVLGTTERQLVTTERHLGTPDRRSGTSKTSKVGTTNSHRSTTSSSAGKNMNDNSHKSTEITSATARHGKDVTNPRGVNGKDLAGCAAPRRKSLTMDSNNGEGGASTNNAALEGGCADDFANMSLFDGSATGQCPAGANGGVVADQTRTNATASFERPKRLKQYQAVFLLDPLVPAKLSNSKKNLNDDEFWLHTTQNLGLLKDSDKVVQQFENSVLTSATSLAYPEVAEMLNRCGIPYDHFFLSGRKLRDSLGLPFPPATHENETDKLKVFCRPLLDNAHRQQLLKHWKREGELPFVLSSMVLQTLNVLSGEAHDACVKAFGKLNWCQERTGSSGNRVRAAVRREVPPDPGLDQNYPIFRAGTRGAVVGTAASAVEDALMEMEEEFGRMLGRAVDEKLRLVLGMDLENVEGYWKVPYKEHLEKAGLAVPCLSCTSVRTKRRNARSPQWQEGRKKRKPETTNFHNANISKDDDTGWWASLLELSSVGGLPPQYVPGQDEYQVNMAYTKIGPRASEGKHTDLSALLTSKSNNRLLFDAQGRRFPTPQMLCVGTYSFGGKYYNAITELVHARPGDGDNAEIFSRIFLPKNSKHDQSAEVQSRLVHHSNTIHASLKDSQGDRVRVTMRHHMDCCHSAMLKDYMRACIEDKLHPEKLAESRRNIYSKYECCVDPDTGRATIDQERANRKTTHWFEGRNFAQEIGGSSSCQSDRKIINWKRFKSLSQEDLVPFQARNVNVAELLPHSHDPSIRCSGIPRPKRKIGSKHATAVDLARKACVVRDLLACNVVPIVMDGDAPSIHQSIRLRDGMPYCSWQLLQPWDLPMTPTTRSNDCVDPLDPSCLLLTKPYKSPSFIVDLHAQVSYDTHLHSLRKGGMSEAEKEACLLELQERFDSLPPMHFGFSGGSQVAAGNRGPSLSASRTDDPHNYTCYPQDPYTDENKALESLVRSGNIVSVCLNQESWFDNPRDSSFYEKDSEKMAFALGGDCEEATVVQWLSEQNQNKDWKKGPSVIGGHTNGIVNDATVPSMGKFHHLFYYRAVNIVRFAIGDGEDGLLQIARSTIHMPGYAKKNATYLSFQMEMNMACILEPALTFRQELMLLSANNDPVGISLEHLHVSDNSKDLLNCEDEVITQKKELSPLAKGLGFQEYPVQLVTDKDMYNVLYGHNPCTKLIDALRDPGVLGKRYSVELKCVPALIMANMLAAAIRSNPERCVRSNGGFEEPIPLIGPPCLVDCIPNPLRQKPAACCNRDEDVSTCVFRHNFEVLVSHNDWAGHTFVRHSSPDVDSYLVPDISKAKNRALLVQAVHTSVIGRLFSPVVSTLFARWKAANHLAKSPSDTTILPTTHESGLFEEFLRIQTKQYKDCGWVFNEQHSSVVPSAFRNSAAGMALLCEFIREHASYGVLIIDEYYAHMAQEKVMFEEVHARRRKDIFEVVRHSIERSCPYFQSPSDLSFLVHVGLADIEAKVPSLFGEVTAETIFLGKGCINGLKLCFSNARDTMHDRFLAFHREITSLLESMDETRLRITGYVRIGGKLFSAFTHREYSFIDSEHILCKIYVCLELSHTSRTISKAPFCHSGWTWPTTAECRFWSAVFSEAMEERIVKPFIGLVQNNPAFADYVKTNYPPLLTYNFEGEETGVEDTNDVMAYYPPLLGYISGSDELGVGQPGEPVFASV